MFGSHIYKAADEMQEKKAMEEKKSVLKIQIYSLFTNQSHLLDSVLITSNQHSTEFSLFKKKMKTQQLHDNN